MDIHETNTDFLVRLLSSGKVLGTGGFGVSYFKSGGGTHLYLIGSDSGKKYLARINYYEPKNGWGIREQEYKVLKLLEPLGIAPKVYYLSTENDLSQHLTIVDYIEGEELKTITDSHVTSLADTLKKLHTSITFNTLII